MKQENVTGQRIVAALIDLVVLAVVFAVMVLLVGEHGTTHSTTTSDAFRSNNTQFQFNLTGWWFGLYLLVIAAYYVGTEAALFATVGKLAMGLRVVSLDGATPSLGQILVRNVLRVVDGLPFLYLVGLITVAASKNHQRVGDMAARTNVGRRATSSPDPAMSFGGEPRI